MVRAHLALALAALVVSAGPAPADGASAAPSADAILDALASATGGALTPDARLRAAGGAETTLAEAVAELLAQRPEPRVGGTGVPPFVGASFVTEFGYGRACAEVDRVALLGTQVVASPLSGYGFGVVYTTDAVTGEPEDHQYAGAAVFAGEVVHVCYDAALGALLLAWVDGAVVPVV